MINFTNEETSLFDYVKSLIGSKEEIEFDFNDPRQYDFATMLTQKSFDTDLYPGKLQALKVLKEQHVQNGYSVRLNDSSNPFVTNFAIPGIGINKGGTSVASNGIGTVAGGFSSMNLTLLIQDNVSKNFVAHGVNQAYADTVLNVETVINPQGSNSMNVTSYLYYTYTSPADGVQSSGLVQKSTGNGTTGDPVLTAPVVTRNNSPQQPVINIGLNRPTFSQGGASDMDYCYYDANTVNQPVGRIPFVGSVTFTQPVRPLRQGSTLFLTINVTNISSGGAVTTLQVSNLNQVYNAFSLSADSKTLKWNLQPPLSASNLGQPITFQNITWPSDLQALFYCFIAVVLQDGTTGFATIQSQNAGEDDALDGTLAIKPLSFIWHCLGEDTLVTMADGTLKPIADLIKGDEVITGTNGESATIEWTNKGAHFGSVLIIETADGKKITTSDNHIFLTEDGPIPAIDLKEGDFLLTENGRATISSIENIPDYDGMFYNIATREYQESATFDGTLGTFIANGFVVGDINAQRAIQYKQRNDIEWVKKQLPEYLYADAETFFKQKTLSIY